MKPSGLYSCPSRLSCISLHSTTICWSLTHQPIYNTDSPSQKKPPRKKSPYKLCRSCCQSSTKTFLHPLSYHNQAALFPEFRIMRLPHNKFFKSAVNLRPRLILTVAPELWAVGIYRLPFDHAFLTRVNTLEYFSSDCVRSAFLFLSIVINSVSQSRLASSQPSCEWSCFDTTATLAAFRVVVCVYPFALSNAYSRTHCFWT